MTRWNSFARFRWTLAANLRLPLEPNLAMLNLGMENPQEIAALLYHWGSILQFIRFFNFSCFILFYFLLRMKISLRIEKWWVILCLGTIGGTFFAFCSDREIYQGIPGKSFIFPFFTRKKIFLYLCQRKTRTRFSGVIEKKKLENEVEIWRVASVGSEPGARYERLIRVTPLKNCENFDAFER